MADIFISYRLEDSKGWALLLRDELCARFGASRVFLDQDSLRAGSWREQIFDELSKCRVFLLVIAPRWTESGRTAGNGSAPRLHDKDDVHRQEIEKVLADSRVTVIPVLVDGASLPLRSQLPDSLAPLLERQARRVSDAAEHRIVDFDILEGDIRRILEEPAAAKPEVLVLRNTNAKTTLPATDKIWRHLAAFAAVTSFVMAILFSTWFRGDRAGTSAPNVTIQGSSQTPVIVGSSVGTVDNRTVVVERPKTTVAPTDVMRRLLPGTPENAVISLLGPPSRSDGDIAVYNRLDNIYIRLIFRPNREVCQLTLQLRDNSSVFEMHPIDVFHLGRTSMHDIFGNLTTGELLDKESDWFPKGGNYSSVTANFGGAGQHFTYTFGISKHLEGRDLEALPHSKETIDFVSVAGDNCPMALRGGLRHFEYH